MAAIDEDQSDLLIAVAAGDLKQVDGIWSRSKLEGGCDIPPIGKIAEKAAVAGQAEVLEWCFAQGFSLPHRTLNNSFYEAACIGQSTAVFQVLLDHGVDLNQHESEFIGDALCFAGMEGNADFAKWLLEHGQNPNANRTPYPGDLEVITYAIAGLHPCLEIVELMHVHNADFGLSAPVIAAAEVGNLKALTLCLDYGVDIEQVMAWGPQFESQAEVGTALYRACRLGQKAAVKILLDRGANGNARDCGGVSCLEIAQERQFSEIVDMLKGKGFGEMSSL